MKAILHRNRARRGSICQFIQSLEPRTLLASFVPNSFLDEVDLTPGNGVVDTTSGNITLRAAIMEANALAGADTITLGAGTYEMGIAGGFEDAGLTGDMDILSELTINGAGAASTIVDGNSIDRLFHVLAGANVKITGLKVTGGLAKGDGASLTGWSGGGVVNNGTLEMTDCIITANAATDAGKSGDGGGLSNGEGTLTLLRVTLSNNTCTDTGAGLRSNGVNARATLIDCTISGNTGFSGMGISNTGGSQVNVIRTTISGNTGNGGGGGIRSEDAGSKATISSSTITGNIGSGGGGLYNINGSEMEVIDSVVTSNQATGAGGNGGGGAYNTGGPMTLRRVTISGNQALNAAGGGLRSNGAVAVTYIYDSTISGNTSNNGGGLANAGGSDLHVTNSTISGNQSISAAGIFNGAAGNDVYVLNSTLTNNTRTYTTTPVPGDIDNPAGGYLSIQNSIVSSVGTSAGPTVLVSLGNNIFTGVAFTSGFQPTDLIAADPKLGPLANNGGPTQTHALLSGSPALNTANTTAAPALDQRGSPRPTGSAADIGACEFDDAKPTVVTASFEYQQSHSIRIQFSENVAASIAAGDLILRPILAGGTLGVSVPVQSTSYDLITNTATFNLPTLTDQNYRATMITNDVSDIAGNALNQNFTFDFYVLAGDANRDRLVDINDLVALANNWMASGKVFSQGDFDYNGVVNPSDLGILAARWQSKLDAIAVLTEPIPTSPAPAARAPVRKAFRTTDQVGLT